MQDTASPFNCFRIGLLAGEIRLAELYSDGGTLREIDTHLLLSFGLVREKNHGGWC